MRALAAVVVGMILASGCGGESQGLVLVDARAMPDVAPVARVLIRIGDEYRIWASQSFVGELPRMTDPSRLGVYVPGGLSGQIQVVVSGLDATNCEVARGTATASLRSGQVATVQVVAKALRANCSDGGTLARADVRPPLPQDVGAPDSIEGMDAGLGRPDGSVRDGGADGGLVGVDAPVPVVDVGLPALVQDAGPDARGDSGVGGAGRDVGAADVPVDAPASGDVSSGNASSGDVSAAVADSGTALDLLMVAAVDMAPVTMAMDVAPDQTLADQGLMADAFEAVVDAEPDAMAEEDTNPPVDMAPDSPPAATSCDEIAQTGCAGTFMCAFGCNTITRMGDLQCVAPGIKATGDTCTATAQCAPGAHCGCLAANDCRCMKYCRVAADCVLEGSTVALPGTNGVCQYRIACSGDPSAVPKAVFLCGRAP